MNLLAAIPAAYGLVFVPRILVVIALKQQRTFDNNNPRDAVKQLNGWGKRAQAAQDNSFESFPAFAAGVLACALTGARPDLAGLACVVYLVARCVYLACYVADVATLRTLVWAVGAAATFMLMLLPVLA